jgi:hypothetical protein
VFYELLLLFALANKCGISKIVAECKKMNRSVPQFSTDFGGLMVTFNAIEFKSTEIIFDVIKDNSNVTIQELADMLRAC